jgi:hypothetical protein
MQQLIDTKISDTTFMYRFISKLIINLLALSYLWIIFILPFQWYKIGPFGEIFPAFDIIIIYYISTYHSLKYWQLFIIGMAIDQLHVLPPGTSSLAFILGNMGLNYFSKWFLVRKYFTNLAVFCGYSAFIILIRYLIVSIKSTYLIEGYATIFYFLTTIFFYPILSALIERSINILGQHAR